MKQVTAPSKAPRTLRINKTWAVCNKAAHDHRSQSHLVPKLFVCLSVSACKGAVSLQANTAITYQ
jgi:hypothetical protein